MSFSLNPGQIATPEAPWLGLRSFTEEAHDYFFGRRAELEDLYERVLDKPLTILFGPSGLGKSSLLQAALIPRLRAQGFLPVLVRFDHEPEAAPLEKQMLEKLREALTSGGFETQSGKLSAALGKEGAKPQWDAAALLWLIFHDPSYGFLSLRGESTDPSPRPVFLIDQFEEIFTLGERPSRRAISLTFREALSALVENRPPSSLRVQLEKDDALVERIAYQAQHAHVLLSLREDFLHLLERWRRSMPSLMENRFELRMLSGPQAFDAVVRPGQLRSGAPPIIPDEVGQAIVRFVAGAEDDVPLAEIDAVPPLLSLVCAELNAQRMAAGELQITRAQFEGQSDEILQSFYLRSFHLASYGGMLEDIPDAANALEVLKCLIEDRLLSPDGYRESIAFDTISRDLSKASAPAAAKAVLDEVVGRRLLTVEERGGVRRLELAHDVLAPIVKASRDERQEKEALAVAQRDRARAEAEMARTLKERNRLKRLAATAVACALIATVGAAFGILGMIRARRAAAEADLGFKAARSATDEFLARTASEEMAYISGIQRMREESANKAIAHYEELYKTRPQEFELRVALAQARKYRAEILGQIGSLHEAVTAFEESLREMEALEQNHGTEPIRLLLADANCNYARFRDAAGLPGGLPHAQAGINLASPLLDRSAEAGRILAWAFNQRGNLESDRARKIEWFEKGRAAALKAQSLLTAGDSSKADVLAGLAATTWNLSRQLSFEGAEAELQRAHELREEGTKLDEQLRQARPDSPFQQRNMAITFEWQAEDLQKEGRMVESRQIREKALMLRRASALTNPSVTGFQNELAYALKEYGQFTARQDDVAAARASYEEAAALAERIADMRADRPANGITLMQVLDLYATFEQYRKSKKDEGNPAKAAEIRQRAIIIGRVLASKYPESISLHFEIAKLLVVHARDQRSDSNSGEALLREAVGLMEAQRIRDPEAVKTEHANQFIRWLTDIEDATSKSVPTAELAKKAQLNERRELLTKAFSWEQAATSYDARQGLLGVASRLGRIYRELDEPQKALELQNRVIALCEGAYREKPYFWYLRNAFADQYQELAKAYQALGSAKEELAAWQKYIEIGLVPDYGREHFAKVLAPEFEASPPNLETLRTVLDWKPKQKLFNIPCNVNGVLIPVQFYIHGGVPGKDADPIADQARWIEEERGVRVPEDMRDSLRKLAAIAHENNVDFVDLCTYALNTPTEGSASETKPIAARRAELQKSAGIKRALLEADPNDERKQMEAAAAIEELGSFLSEQHLRARAEEQLLEALALRQKLLAAKNEDADRKKAISAVYWKLGVHYASNKDWAKALPHHLAELNLVREREAALSVGSKPGTPGKESPSKDEVKARESLAASVAKMSDIYQALGQPVEAARYAEEHIQLDRKLATDQPQDQKLQMDLAVALLVDGKTICLTGWQGLAQAQTHLDEAATAFAGLKEKGQLSKGQSEWPGIARRLATNVANALAAKHSFKSSDAGSVLRLANAIFALGSEVASPELVKEGLDGLQAIPTGDKHALEAQKLLSTTFYRLERLEEAEAHLGRWLFLAPNDALALEMLADVRFKTKQFLPAAETYSQLLKVSQKSAGARPVKETWEATARALLNLGTCYQNAMVYDQAEIQLLAALKWCRDPKHQPVLGPEWEIKCRDKLVSVYLSTKRAGEARAQQEAVRALWDTALEAASQSNAELARHAAQERMYLAQMQADGGYQVEAAKTYGSALTLWRSEVIASKDEVALAQCIKIWVALGEIAAGRKEPESALQHARTALDFCQQHGAILSEDKLRPILAVFHGVVREQLLKLRRYDEAVLASQKIVEFKQGIYDDLPKDEDAATQREALVSAYSNLAWAQILARRFGEAVLSAQTSLKLAPQIWVEANLAHALLFAGRLDEAMIIYRKHRGEKIEINNAPSWEEMVKADFREFRAAGLEHGSLTQIEAELGITPHDSTK